MTVTRTSLRRALREALDEEMQRDERVCLFGEDVGEFGGVWGTWTNLQKKYSLRRVFDTPLSESAILGLAAGAAMTGLRPVAEIMYMDFITVGMDPLVNQAAKLRLMSGGQFCLPMVVCAQFGSGTAEAAQHSQSLEAWFIHTPGLKVVMPATIHDAKGLLKASIRDNNPVVYLWHRGLYSMEEELPAGECYVPLGQAVVRKSGRDVTVVATALSLHKACAAARDVAGRIDVEVIDPRTLAPLDIETILTSVRKTGRLLVVHDAPACGGFGAEVVRRVTEEAYGVLQAPPRVLGGAKLPMPFAPELERACLPQQEDIVAALETMIHGGSAHE